MPIFLVCPKTGIANIDPDEKTHCVECAKKYIAGGMRNSIDLMSIDRSLFEYARRRAIREMLIDQGYAVIFTTNDEMRKEFFQVVEEVKQELASEGVIIKTEI